MPELPEVENVVRNLNKEIKSKVIKNITIITTKMLRNTSIDELNEAINNKQVKNVWRKGKYIIIDIDKYCLVNHLRMEGRWYHINSEQSPLQFKHTCAFLEFTDQTKACYIDTRKFGTFDLFLKSEINESDIFQRLGTDGNDENLDYNEVYKKLSKMNKKIKTALLDQSTIAGIGNIYADEILFKSKINPTEIAKNLSIEKIKTICINTKLILDKAIEYGGSTISSFEISKDVHGDFSKFLNVYQKENTPCVNCSKKITKIVVNGRGTRFCERCQPLL